MFTHATHYDLYAPGIRELLKTKTPNEVVEILARLLHKDNPKWTYKKLARRYVNVALR